MSFFRKLKEKVTAPDSDVSLRFNKTNFFLGENVEGTLTVSSKEEFDAKEIRCEIQCVEEAKRTKRMYDSGLKHEVYREVWESATLYSEKSIVSSSIHISKGYLKEFPLSINIPVGARPTYHSIDAKVTWTIKGVIAVDGRPDVTSKTAELQVAQPRAAPTIREREVIREIVMIPCKYCGTLMPQTETICPKCGARRTA